jgi:hypothetical protein
MALARALASHFEQCQRKNSLRVNGQGMRLVKLFLAF